MNLIKKGSTDVTRYVNLVDSAAGTPETGYTITNLDLQYTRNRTAPAAKVDAVALAATDSSHTDNRAIEIDGTSSPGLYRIDWPDAAFATGADKVILVVSGSGLHPAIEEIQLVGIDVEDAVRGGMSALPNAAADAAGGLPISDAGGLDLDAQLVTKINDILTDTGTTLQGELDGIQADTEDIQTRLPAALTAGGNMKSDVLAISGDTGAADNLETAADGGSYNLGGGGIVAASVAGNVGGIAGTTNTFDALQTALNSAHGAGSWATATGFSTHSAADVWAVATRVLTAGTNIVLAKGTGVTGFNDLDAAGVRTAVGLASANLDTQFDALPTAAENFAAVLTTQMTEAYAADGTAPTLAQAVFLTMQSLHEFAIVGTTRTVKKLDGSTTAAAFTLDDATTPTSTTRSS